MPNEPEYLLPNRSRELERLAEQDAWITHEMHGQRILAPIDLTQPGLRILDSGTANGLFLREIQPQLTAPYTLLGYDVMESFFPPAESRPEHTTFALHDIAEPWPSELQYTCDFVHQRFTLPGGAKKATPREMVGYLCRLVKPGGWIQLVEMDPTVPAESKAMEDAWVATRAFLTAAGAGVDYGRSLAGWLREEGFQNVEDKRINIDAGKSCADPDWGVRSAKSLAESFGGAAGACKAMNVDVDPSILENLGDRAEAGMMAEGGFHPLVFAYGQKPAA
ncbi:methyltransferase SirN-like protein [Xylariaceae sp. FL0804]|nr:methyltransferase SirN-like protein [Xylariaceae sp. FL0804]